ncbi:MAG: DUF1573 domain-containing protein [Dysgonomonas sp.]
MKKLSFLLMFTILSFGYIMAQDKKDAPKAEFETTVHDFGKIAEEIGQVTCTFTFTNTGKTPLIINSVNASCGCTTPSYTSDPVLPGKKGEIKVAYSATGRVGTFEKGIRVMTNVPDEVYRLTIKGEVLPRK